MSELFPADAGHEEMGPVLWWRFPINEPPYVGSPLDYGYTVLVEVNGKGIGSTHVGGWIKGYYTHFTKIALPSPPAPAP